MDDLLPEEAQERLVETSRRVLGDRLRSVTYFTQNDFDQVHLREDLERDADLSSFIGVEWRESDITENAYQDTELGDHSYTIRAFDNGYLARVSTLHEGVFVTTDKRAGPDELTLRAFDQVMGDLHDILVEWHGDE